MTQPLQHEPRLSETHHASRERAGQDELEALAARALSDPILGVVLDAVGGYAMVLDEHRQIISANEGLLAMLGTRCGQSLLGLRPGEAVCCLNADRGPAGCGTSLQCRHCGAVAAILAARVAEQPVEGQCTITRWVKERPRVADFEVRVSPVQLCGKRVFVVVLRDITSVKWRELQSRMFLHDMANMLTGLNGWGNVLAEEQLGEATTELVEIVQRLTDSLQSHRLLLDCEAGERILSPQPVVAEELSTRLRAVYAPTASKKKCLLVVAWEPGPVRLVTDLTLLLRVLGNLVTNAIEASEAGAQVTVTVQPTESQTTFLIHNEGVIPELTAAQLRKMRFSTKGSGRGLGMYSVQVFGEQYLGGQVDFETSRENGTLFRFVLPNTPPTPERSLPY